MEPNENIQSAAKMPILEIAWTRYAQLDRAAKKLEGPHYAIRRWVAILGVVATFLAVIIQTYPENFPVLGKVILKVLLIIAPISISVLVAFLNKFYGNDAWLVLRAGAEEIKKEIYNFRTVLKKDSERRAWLEKRLADIQRQVYRGMGGEMVLEPYKGEVPPYYDPDDPQSDPGFHDLTGDEYFTYRLQKQLAWHINKNNRIQAERTRLQWGILIAGGVGSFLAAMGGTLTIWVAVTVSLSAALIGWSELRNLDSTLKNYSKVIMELMTVFDHWKNLEPEERTNAEFFKMVKGTEKVLWGQNLEYILAMQDVLEEDDFEEADLTDEVLPSVIPSNQRMETDMDGSVVEHRAKTEEKVSATFDGVLGTIAEEAASDLVQQELAAMREADEQTVDNLVKRASKMRAALDQVQAEFGHIDFDADTPAAELHAMLERLPKTGEVKG